MSAIARTALTLASLATGALALAAGDARAQAPSPWSIGIDASVRSITVFAGGNRGPSGTLTMLPDSIVRVGYRVSPWFQLEVPFRLAASSIHGLAVQQVVVGVNANLFYPRPGRVRPFVGGGPTVAHTHYRTDYGFREGEQVTESGSYERYGFTGRVGLEWRAIPALSFRPALLFEHQSENRSRGLVGYDAIGLSLGSTLHFGPEPAAPARSPRFQLGFGGELSRTTSADGGESAGPRTLLEAPRAIVGLFFPIDSTRQTLAGANLALARSGTIFDASSDITLQPRIELNLRPDFRERTGFRVGLQGDVRHLTGRSLTQLGAGADVALTVPVNHALLYRVGFGYDYFPKRPSASLPAQGRLALKFGVDAL